MVKSKTQYQCNDCGGISPKWQGQCPQCGAWNSLQETVVSTSAAAFQSWSNDTGGVQALTAVESAEIKRIATGISELDQVLGGGLVAGAVTLLGGDPGIGKSTLFLQVLAALAAKQQKVLYVSGEESPRQVALRAKRLGLKTAGIDILAEININKILPALTAAAPHFVVIDSIQTLYAEELSAAPGSVSQVRECAARLTRSAKQSDMSILIVGHVTKDGAIAGPRVLEHMVDTVLYFEGDSYSNLRMIRAIKNRFGAANELGVFAMLPGGLAGVSNPSAIFLASYRAGVVGSGVMVTQEGTRPLLVEIQALVDESRNFNPRRLTVGLDNTRLNLLLAVLNRQTGAATANQDVFLNAVGGIKIIEPAADLAVILAVYSSLRNQPLPAQTVIFGEIGLAGEIRPVSRGQERLKEAEKLGFTKALIPYTNLPKDRKIFPRLQITAVKTLKEAVTFAFPENGNK